MKQVVAQYKKDKGVDKIEWAQHQLLSCYDYNCESPFWNRLSIHLNNQMCHHIFPSVHPCHYIALRRVLMPIAAKYGIDYQARSENTFTQAVVLYWNWIFDLNEVTDVAGKGGKWLTTSVLYGGAATVAFLTVAGVMPLYYRGGVWFA